MNSGLVLIMLVALLPMASGSFCRYETCDGVTCSEINPDDCAGRIVTDVHPCLGCCDFCITFIAPGAQCEGWEYQFYQQECSPGYSCDYEGTQTCLPNSDAIPE